MGKYLKNRNPLTRAEVEDYLNKEVAKMAKQWGEDYIYTRWARERRDSALQEFDAGKVIEVWKEGYSSSYGNGTGDYEDVLLSDGTVKTICYGYMD